MNPIRFARNRPCPEESTVYLGMANKMLAEERCHKEEARTTPR